ncbi:hypothetical protein BDV38DRAFT_245977 [Aspergillus pseudotamarii]|uniref:Uncharacterized protein n=1 Tax=Aspergillus pseudotamarii TaxID=132259 RepID=A0A5N6SVW8_ASPPS|nr:uncharacterized protein BDV38DRAFT_245977 [Aspergillus pseudotamarii]KAE8137969.1 hypothetical protein BDV38DRAFT_245977 [Aspergillus pseudotamarii]
MIYLLPPRPYLFKTGTMGVQCIFEDFSLEGCPRAVYRIIILRVTHTLKNPPKAWYGPTSQTLDVRTFLYGLDLLFQVLTGIERPAHEIWNTSRTTGYLSHNPGATSSQRRFFCRLSPDTFVRSKSVSLYCGSLERSIITSRIGMFRALGHNWNLVTKHFLARESLGGESSVELCLV